MSTPEVPVSAAAPATTAPGSIRCPRCGAEVGPEQDWCLHCGAPARTRLAPTPAWKVPLVALAIVAVLVGAALAVGFVALTKDPDPPRAAVPAATTAPAPVAPAATAPPATAAVPPATAAAPAATVPPATTPAATAPAGTPTLGTTPAPSAGSTVPGLPGVTTPGAVTAPPGG